MRENCRGYGGNNNDCHLSCKASPVDGFIPPFGRCFLCSRLLVVCFSRCFLLRFGVFNIFWTIFAKGFRVCRKFLDTRHQDRIVLNDFIAVYRAKGALLFMVSTNCFRNSCNLFGSHSVFG